MPTTTTRVRVKLALEEKTTPEVVSTLRGLANAIPGNVYLTPADITKLPVAVPDMLTNAATLETTHAGRVAAPSKAATALERTQRGTAEANITDTANYLEGVANVKAAGDTAQATVILGSFGLQTRSTPAAHALVAGFIPAPRATFHLHIPAPSTKGAHANLVQYSLDGTTWLFPVVVLGPDLLVTGVKSGANVTARYARNLPPPKGHKATVVWGSEQPIWSDLLTYLVT